ncbi:hypothetical protein NX059_011434 [Plenodomus lindquistii]|nr:hypothetical protein NX059_011434 [Plenodomus lindquistii]
MSEGTDRERARAARAKCEEALYDSRKARSRLVQLQEDAKPFYAKERALKSCADSKKAAAANELMTYASTLCLELCEKMQTRLPREIRDMIVPHIAGLHDAPVSRIDEFTEHISVPYFESRSRGESGPKGINTGTKHCWDVRFVGPDTLRELGEHYYKSVCFAIDSSDLHLLSRFRTFDVWRFGLLPASFVHKIHVNVNANAYDLDDKWHLDDDGLEPDSQASIAAARAFAKAKWGHQGADEKYLIPKSVAGLLNQLESLFGFKSRSKLYIRVQALRDSYKDPFVLAALEKQKWMMNKVAHVVFPTLNRLVQSGLHLELSLEVRKRHCPATFNVVNDFSSFHKYEETFSQYAQAKLAEETQALQDGLGEERWNERNRKW